MAGVWEIGRPVWLKGTPVSIWCFSGWLDGLYGLADVLTACFGETAEMGDISIDCECLRG